jgi:hypothetical protein
MQKPEITLVVKNIEPNVAVLLSILEVPNSNIRLDVLIDVS